jgi:site-specific recombinase XerD
MNTLLLTTPTYIQLCSDFNLWVRTVGYAGKQPDTYTAQVSRFLSFIEKHGIRSVDQIRNNHLVAFHQHLCNCKHPFKGRPLASSTIKHYFNVLRLFFNYLNDTGELEGIPNHLYLHFRAQHQRRQVITVDEIKLMLTKASNSLEKAILCCAYGCGLRRSEITKLNIKDIDLRNKTLLVRYAKMHKSRVVPLTNQVAAMLKCYLHKYRFRMKRNDSLDAFFMHKNGKRMSGSTLNMIVKRIIRRTEDIPLIQKGITLHCLRHSIATHLIDNGASIEFVKDFLGHSDIDSTNLYAIQRRIQNKLIRSLQV